MDTATYLSLIMKIVCISDINFFFQSKQIMSTSEEIPPSAKDWVKSSALYPFSPFCWHLPLLLSSVSCSTSRCVVCFPLHVTYNLSASYILHVTYNLPQGSTLTITYYDGVLPTTEIFFFREWCVFKFQNIHLSSVLFVVVPFFLTLLTNCQWQENDQFIHICFLMHF